MENQRIEFRANFLMELVKASGKYCPSFLDAMKDAEKAVFGHLPSQPRITVQHTCYPGGVWFQQD